MSEDTRLPLTNVTTGANRETDTGDQLNPQTDTSEDFEPSTETDEAIRPLDPSKGVADEGPTISVLFKFLCDVRGKLRFIRK